MAVRALWFRNGTLHLIDQRELPDRRVVRHLRHAREVADAIRSMAVRGAPAIGVAAATPGIYTVLAPATSSFRHGHDSLLSVIPTAEGNTTASP